MAQTAGQVVGASSLRDVVPTPAMRRLGRLFRPPTDNMPVGTYAGGGGGKIILDFWWWWWCNSDMAISNYPLCWPAGWKRTPSHSRENGRFSRKESVYRPSTVPGGQGYRYTQTKNLTVSDGVGRILESLERIWISRDDIIISTNVRTRLDGLPRSGEREPDDPGAAVYWRKGMKGQMRCMAIDRYTTVADNLAAIAATLEAMRAIERHGGAEILDRTFTGFAALPEKAGGRAWWDVLEVPSEANRETVESAFRRLARERHPDRGGSEAQMAELNEARRLALETIQ